MKWRRLRRRKRKASVTAPRKTQESAVTPSASSATVPVEATPTRLPLRGWAVDLARRWNGNTYSVFVIHGNIFDVFPVQSGTKIDHAPLKTFLARRLFPDRGYLLFYDIGDGLTFGNGDMQKRFFEWLEVYDEV